MEHLTWLMNCQSIFVFLRDICNAKYCCSIQGIIFMSVGWAICSQAHGTST